MAADLEWAACTPAPLVPGAFNRAAALPHGLRVEHLQAAMSEFLGFLEAANSRLHERNFERLETVLMPAGFSSLVGEFAVTAIPKYCPTLAKNQYHNGHPDLLRKGLFPKDAVQHAPKAGVHDAGVEAQASRYGKRWQGHSEEDTWLMVFVYDANRPSDGLRGKPPRPFRT